VKRGDLVVGAAGGDYGKPRPWLVVQTDLVPRDFASVTLCPLTTDVTAAPSFRVHVAPSADNGLRTASDVMVDKVQSLPRRRIRSRIGALEPDTLRAVDTALRLWLGLA
jgi:mRNA interferase MazF